MFSFGSKEQQQALDALVAATNAVLRPVGFEKAGKWEWQRKTAWRIDEVDLVVKGGTSKHLMHSFRVLLPRTKPSQFGDKYQHIAQINVAQAVASHGGSGVRHNSSIFEFRQGQVCAFCRFGYQLGTTLVRTVCNTERMYGDPPEVP